MKHRFKKYWSVFFFWCLAQTMSYSQNNWEMILPDVGSFSSIRVTDLTSDGVQDIVMGAGRLEFQKCDTAVVAIDGKNGEILWNVPASDQIFGSAIFQDITGDQINDVFIGGRSAELMAIDGKNGVVLWRFLSSNSDTTKWFNFYNPQFISDQDQDGLPDLLVSNGGDVFAAPHDPNRPPGYLLILSSKTGKLLSKAIMPDNRETYLSAVVTNLTNQKDETPKVIFGTGGETIGGSFFIAELEAVLQEDLSKAIQLDSSQNKGYIGPPVVVDITNDQVLDIVTNSVDGRLLAFDGKTKKQLWEVVVPDTESYGSTTVGYFNKDSIPDLFVAFGQGVWPDLGWSVQIMVNGKTGEIEFQDSLGYYQNSTALAADLNNDGVEEVIMSLNFQEVNEVYQKFFYNTLVAIEFETKEIIQISNNFVGSNLSSTPWIGDLDGNGFLDILYSHGMNPRHTYTFDGMRLLRMDTEIPISKKIKWGSYQGSNFDGVFEK